MINKEQAMRLGSGNKIYFGAVPDPDARRTYFDKGIGYETHDGKTVPGSKVRQFTVNGACKTWKTRPNDWCLPIKYGLYEYGYVGTVANCEDPARFYLTPSEAEVDTVPQVKVGKRSAAKLEKLLDK